jgi:hypothetical protein
MKNIIKKQKNFLNETLFNKTVKIDMEENMINTKEN